MAPRELPIAECRLDLAGSRAQRDRYRALGEHVADRSRGPCRLMVRFDAAVDPILLAETLAIERECCDFFDLRYSEAERELEVTVADKRQDPALDAIGESLGIRSG